MSSRLTHVLASDPSLSLERSVRRECMGQPCPHGSTVIRSVRRSRRGALLIAQLLQERHEVVVMLPGNLPTVDSMTEAAFDLIVEVRHALGHLTIVEPGHREQIPSAELLLVNFPTA